MPVPVLLPRVAAPLASAYANTGWGAEAIALLEPLARQREEAGFKFGRSAVLIALAEVYVHAGQIDAAVRLGGTAIGLCDELGARGQRAWASRLLGEAYARRDPPDPARAEAFYRETLALAEKLDMRPLQAHALAGLGALHFQTDARGEARSTLLRAASMFRSMGMITWASAIEIRLEKGGVGPLEASDP